MNILYPSVLWAAALLPAAPPEIAAPPEPLAGRFLVLPNQRTLEGDIERVGDQYRVRRPVGETWVGVDKARRLCATSQDVYVYLRSQLKPDDLDGRVRVADWCRDHDLRAQAIAETECVLKLQKDHPQAAALLKVLKQPTTTAGTQPVPATPLPEPPPVPNLELTAEVLNHFAIRVQPILMNTCAGCHNEARGTAFRLTRVPDGGVTNRRTLQQNVSAVLSFVSIAQPMNSPFLTKAVTVHWPTSSDADLSQAPFRNRHAPAYRALEDWVRMVVPTTDTTVDTGVPLPPIEVRTPPITPVKTEMPAPVGPLPVEPPKRVDPPPMTPGTPAGPDVYSPDDFNRRNHPERGK
jgi:hypothetical protein